MRTNLMAVFRIILPASIDHLGDFIQALSCWLEQEGMAKEKISRVQLAVEEALVNVIRYAYQGGAGEVELRGAVADDQRLTIQIMDRGIPFNVCAVPKPDVRCGIRDRKVGGLGVYLIHRMVDELVYRREGDQNVLTMFINRNLGNLAGPRQDVHAGA
ncbi:MAG TPA: ATP-binding protein [Syntrophales bacterium]|nr:ATP-binding protein [Syntrophales bacterium]